MVTKAIARIKADGCNSNKVANDRLSYCRYCAEPVFKIRVELEQLGWRSWWHEAEELDSQHIAEPDGRVRDG